MAGGRRAAQPRSVRIVTDFFVRGERFWFSVLAVATTALVTFEMLLLGLGTGYFTGGYQSEVADGFAAIVLYLVGSSILDAILIVTSWLICLPILSQYRGGPFRCASMALLVGIVPAGLSTLVQYQIHVILGELVSTSLLDTGSAGSSTSAIAVISEFVPPSHVTVLLICGLLGASLPFIGRRLDLWRQMEWVTVPSQRSFVSVALIGAVLGSGLLVYSVHSNPSLYFGLTKKTSGRLLSYAMQAATDWDRDGYGFLSRPSDPDPFDSSIHPYAIDLAGNGVDENGLGGDHPITAGTPLPEKPVPPASAKNPHVLLIFLETFRAELLDTDIDGKPVTPYLTELARSSARSDRMFVHSPWTLASRTQLFQGAIVADPEAGTLLEDFIARGYETAHFSGQDDSYGDSAERLGFHRAGHFYDARGDVHRRTTRSTAAVSLQVSWQTVLERVDAYLDAYDSDQPLFLYVNIVDTHFPFTHSEIEEIIASPALDRSEIRARYADRVFRAYANTAANVDRSVERLVEHWRTTFADQDQAIVITADHGESFYENDTLGHGQTVAAVETRVPLIVQGIGGEWPEPIGIADLRGLIAGNLGVETGDVHPEFRVDPDRSLFQYLGSIEEAEQIALRRSDSTHVLDIRTGEAWRLGPDESRIEEQPSRDAIDELIWTWEAYQSSP
jgi:hypothetical protein